MNSAPSGPRSLRAGASLGSTAVSDADRSPPRRDGVHTDHFSAQCPTLCLWRLSVVSKLCEIEVSMGEETRARTRALGDLEEDAVPTASAVAHDRHRSNAVPLPRPPCNRPDPPTRPEVAHSTFQGRHPGYRGAMSDVQHKVVLIGADSVSGEALEAQIVQQEAQGWELAAALPHQNGQASLVFKRPRPLLGSPG